MTTKCQRKNVKECRKLPGLLRLLLRHLLELDRLRELPPERAVRDGDVVQDEPELLCALGQLRVYAGGDELSLGDELPGVELGHHGLQDLVGDGGEHTVVVVDAEGGVDA